MPPLPPYILDARWMLRKQPLQIGAALLAVMQVQQLPNRSRFEGLQQCAVRIVDAGGARPAQLFGVGLLTDHACLAEAVAVPATKQRPHASVVGSSGWQIAQSRSLQSQLSVVPCCWELSSSGWPSAGRHSLHIKRSCSSATQSNHLPELKAARCRAFCAELRSRFCEPCNWPRIFKHFYFYFLQGPKHEIKMHKQR